MLVRKAVEEYAVSAPRRKDSGMLYVSDLGRHPYLAMARVLHGETADFPVETRIKMNYGNAFEAETLRALQHRFPGVQTQFPLYDDIWSGYADFFVQDCENGRCTPTIIEHKATGDQWFDYKQSLPRAAHVCQLWMYGHLYTKTHSVAPNLVLYYVAWGNYAEFTLREEVGMIIADGAVNGMPSSRVLGISPNNLRKELEFYYNARLLPDSDGSDDWDYAATAHERLIHTYFGSDN